MTKKLQLDNIEVKSFTTCLDPEAQQRIKGGTDPFFCEPTDPDPCGTTGCGTRVGCGGSGGCGGGGQTNHNTCNCTAGFSGACIC